MTPAQVLVFVPRERAGVLPDHEVGFLRALQAKLRRALGEDTILECVLIDDEQPLISVDDTATYDRVSALLREHIAEYYCAGAPPGLD